MVFSQKQQFWQALGFAWTLGYTIAIPLVVFALVGRFLDRRFGTDPWLLIAGMILSIVISSIALVQRSMTLISRLGSETTEKSVSKEQKKP